MNTWLERHRKTAVAFLHKTPSAAKGNMRTTKQKKHLFPKTEAVRFTAFAQNDFVLLSSDTFLPAGSFKWKKKEGIAILQFIVYTHNIVVFKASKHTQFNALMPDQQVIKNTKQQGQAAQ